MLGDFGLACVLSMGVGDGHSEMKIRNHHSSGVGTLTYSAPEQLNSSNYGPKV